MRLAAVAGPFLVAAALCLPAGAEPPAPPPVRQWADALDLDSGVAAVVAAGREIQLRVIPEEGDDFPSLGARFCGDPGKAELLEQANGGGVPVPGRAIIVPWDLVREEYRFLALRAFFPADRFDNGAWEHRPAQARGFTYDEGLWQAALWFTGRGENWEKVARFNNLAGPGLPSGKPLLIPAELLLPLFKPALPLPGGELVFDQDDQGAYARYRLKRGEALYTNVVLRFTSLVSPQDVLAAADLIARRSGIGSVNRMPVGQAVKIPLDLLSVAFLPPNHPRRIVARIEESELDRAALLTPPATLQGVHVILDPGHGGDDIGARSRKIWESDYVYDIACRVRRLLQTENGVTVHMTVKDTQYGFAVSDKRALTRNRREVVLTDPPHRNRAGRGVRVGVHLRWYLANSLLRRLTEKEKVAPEKIVFLSLHADSLHRDLSGGMVYIPGERLRRGDIGLKSKAYDRYREVRERPVVRTTRAERLRDEAASRRLGQAILAGFRGEKLRVAPAQPLRDSIVRGVKSSRRPWLPAVLKGNLVPAKVLVETANMNNPQDALLLEDPAGREKIARAVVAGLRQYFQGVRQNGKTTAARVAG